MAMANLLRLAPLLIVLTLLAGLPTAVNGQQQITVKFAQDQFGSNHVSVTEDDPTVSVTIELSQSLPSQFEIGVRTRDGSAQSGTDYQSLDTTVTFPANSTSQTVSITILDDSDNEGDEQFYLDLHSPSNSSVTVAGGFAIVTIVNDDFVVIQLESATYTTNEAGPTSVEIRAVMLQGTIDTTISVQLVSYDGTAVAFQDYIRVSTNLTFQPGATTSSSATVSIYDDRVMEALRETFAVSLQSITDTRVGVNTLPSTISIEDDDRVLLRVARAYDWVTEAPGASIPFCVVLLGSTSIGIPVTLQLSHLDPDGALSPAPPNPAPLITFEAGDSRVCINLPIGEVSATTEVLLTISTQETRVTLSEPTEQITVVAADPFERNRLEDFDSLGISGLEGIWSDGWTMWVSRGRDTNIYAYDLIYKQRDSAKDLTLDSLAGNGDPQAIWGDGKAMWVGDGVTTGPDGSLGYIYAYKLDINNDGSVGSEHGTRESAKDFDPNRGSNPRGIWSNGPTMWVSQARGGGTGDIRAYQIDINADGSAGPNHGSGEPTEGLENVAGEGIWSDGTTLWVALERQIYAYDLATKSRVPDKDFTNLEANAQGIWSDGRTMWVVAGNEIHAYNMPGVSRRPVVDRRPATVTQEIYETEPARPSVIKPDLCVADIVDPDGGEVELGDTINDSWVGGCPSVTRGGRLAKYYSFNLPITTTAEIALDSHLDDYLVLRRGGLSGNVVEQDDDDGPGNNSLISGTLKAGRYTIEATTFYADGVEADFTLSVKAVPRILYDGPVADIAHVDYTPDGPTMTVKLLPTLPMGTLEVTIEDADGFGEGTGPLGGALASGGSAGTAILALPKTAWVQYDGITVETRESGSWTAHTQADEQAILTRHAAVPDLSPALLSLVRLIGKAEGALQLLQSLAGLSSPATDTSSAEPDGSVLETIFRKSHANCVAQVTVPWLMQVTVPWLMQETDTTGVRVSVPVMLQDDDYLSLAASFKASGNEPALAQLHDLLTTGSDAPDCLASPSSSP